MSTAEPIQLQPLYKPDQLPALIRLLAEYTVDLKKQSLDMLTTQRDRDEKTIRNSFTLIGIVIVQSLVLGTFGKPTKWSGVDEVMTVLVITSTLALAFSSINLYRSLNALRNVRRLELLSTVSQLERLVRRISPIAENANIGLGEKLELDLRLADADAALEYAAQYTGKRIKSENGLAHSEVLEISHR